MELALLELQQSIYGDNGPPMFPHPDPTTGTRRTKRRKLNSSSEPFKLPPIKPVNELRGPETLVACQLPDGFPPELAFRALAAYALLRTLSRQLRLSPFTPNVFLRALNLPFPSRLLGQIHVNLLRILLPRLNLGYGYRPQGGSIGTFKKRRLDGIRWPLLGGDNLTYLDNYTWPLFYDDYCHLTADVLWVSMNDTNLYVDMRQIGLPTENSDDDHDKDEDNYNARMLNSHMASPATKKNIEPGKISRASEIEPLPDSDDEYDGDEDEAITGDNDDDFQALSFQNRKRGRPVSRQSLPRKVNRSTRSSTRQVLRTESLSTPTNTHVSLSNCTSHSSSSNTMLRERSIKTRLDLASVDPPSSSAKSCTSKSETTSRTTPDASNVTLNSNVLVSDLEVVSGSPLSNAVIVGIERCDSSTALSRERIVGIDSDVGIAVTLGNNLDSMPHFADVSLVNGNKRKSKVPRDESVIRDRNNPGTSAQGIILGSRQSLSGLSELSSRPEPFISNGLQDPGKSASIPTTAYNKRPAGRFALPLNRARNQAASNVNISVENRSPHHSIWSIRNEGSVSTEKTFQFQTHAASSSRVRLQNLHADSRTAPDNCGTALTNSEMQKRKVDVSADIVDELESAFMGMTGTQSFDATREIYDTSKSILDAGDDATVTEGDSIGMSDKTLNDWPQFNAVKRMRRGVPYHRLPLADKVDILEFLIDELVAIDFIAAEFTRRDATNGGHPFPYGCLPSQVELESLENEDECGICAREGDLLCCDACTSSYHTYCLGMAQSTRIPEGKWVCPECRLVDPCKFGSLREGKKSSVDWFTLQDLETAEKLKGHSLVQLFDVAFTSPAAYSEQSIFHDDEVGGELVSVEGQNIFESSRRLNEVEFLVVGSFVFTRPRIPMRATSSQDASILPLGQDGLSQLLVRLGPELGSKWPFAQVPLIPTEMWITESPVANHVPSTLYFATLDSHDPSFYWSQYRKAPLPKCMKAGSGAQSATLAELENEFLAVDTNKLSGVLSRDTQFDGKIIHELKSSTILFNPYHVLASYLIRLEGSLRKASLLDETWGTKNSDYKTDVWVNNVKRCRSIPRLALLVVRLIDASHPRSFVEEWHKTPGNSKSIEHSSMNTVSLLSSRRFNLPKDWSSEAELRRRKWERCPLWATRDLMSKSSQDGSRGLCSFASEQPTGRKRKQGKMPTKMEQPGAVVGAVVSSPDAPTFRSDQQSTVNGSTMQRRDEGPSLTGTLEKAQNTTGLHAVQFLVETECNVDAMLHDEEKNGKSFNRRRPDRVTTRSGAWATIESTAAVETDELPLSQMDLLVENEYKKKMVEVEKLVRGPASREAHWPVAGRRLFEPAGCLPPSEMRHLARKAGAVAAQFVTYSASHEVGQTPLSHRWRKRTLECRSYEELLLRIKSLESYLDTTTIAAGDAVVRKMGTSKKQNNFVIDCSHRDIQTGVMEYFVTDKDHKRGCWVSLANIEMGPLAAYSSDRVESQLKKMECRKKLELERRQKATLAASIRSIPVVAPTAPVVSQEALHVAGQLHQGLKDLPKKIKHETSDIVTSTSALDARVLQWNQEVEAALLQHQLETSKLMVERTKHGLSLLPPESQMHELRLQRIRALKAPLEALRRCGDSNALEAEVVARLTQAEINALKMFEGTQPVKNSTLETLAALPAISSRISPVPSLPSNYSIGTAMGGASFGQHNSNGIGRSVHEPSPSFPSGLSSYTMPVSRESDNFARALSSPSQGVETSNTPYIQLRPPGLAQPNLSYQQNPNGPYHNAGAGWSQNSGLASSHGIARSPYGPGTGSNFMNPSMMAGMFDNFPQFRNNGIVNDPQQYQTPFQMNPPNQFFSQQGNLNSLLPSFQHNSMASIPGATTNQFNYHQNLGPTSIPEHQQFASRQANSSRDLLMGIDLEPRPIEEMSRNSQDLESLLRRFARNQR